MMSFLSYGCDLDDESYFLLSSEDVFEESHGVGLVSILRQVELH